MSKSKKLPHMPFYFGDWKKDLGVQALDRHDRSVWLDMLGLMWESEQRGVLVLNKKPMISEQIARALGMDNQTFEISLSKILANGVASLREDGAIYCRRMVRDEELSSKRSKAGSMGGNPNLLKQNGSKAPTVDNQKSDNDIDIKDLDLKNNGAAFAQPELPPIDTSDEYAIKAREILETPAQQPWTRSNAFICEGRRPMRKFPKIFLREPDLARILREIEDAGVPRGQVQKVFQAATDRIVAGERSGKRSEGLAIEAWLTGFCLTETIEVLKKGMQLKQTKERAHV